MLGVTLLVLSIGIVDSLNPSTVGPALYLALQPEPTRRLAGFTAGVFAVYLVGGIILTLGPGQIFPQPGRHTRYLLEMGLGVGLLVFAAVLFLARERVGRHLALEEHRVSHSSLLLGAAIMIVELPTSFPYFAAIAAIVAADKSIVTEIALLVLFNAAFIAPLLAIFGVVTLTGERGRRALERLRAWLTRRAPVFLPLLIAVIAVALILAGAIRLA